MEQVLVIGTGAREHVIVETLLKSERISKVYVLDGNTGMESKRCFLVENVNVNNFEEIERFCKNNSISLVFIGPEKYLMDGLTDYLEKTEIKCFGPTRHNTLLTEGSKIKSKNIMKKLGLPTTPFVEFNLSENDYKNFIFHLGKNINKYVIKKNGLSAGKGVYLPNNINDAFLSIEECMNDVKCKNILIEERLYGEEVSVMAFCNGEEVWLMPQTQDFKRIYDDDLGNNTGGMGAICPANILNEKELDEVREYMNKVVKGCKGLTGKGYVGVLYAGIMKTENGLFFLEFNSRFGDPEAQTILNLLDSDLYKICLDCIDGNQLDVKWKSGYVANVVMSHEDYPLKKSTEPLDVTIHNIFYKSNNKIYWSNVKREFGVNYTTGGRVCSVVNYSKKSLYDALQNVYNSCYHIKYRNQFYRRDIGLNYIINNGTKNRKIKIAILGSTRGTSTQLLIDKIKNKELNAKIEVIISNKKNGGILDRAKDNGLPFIYLPFYKKKLPYYMRRDGTRESYDLKLVNLLNVYDVDVVLLVGYMRIVTSVLINKFRGRIFNIHPSLLPKHAGGMDLDVHKRVLEWNEKFTGCTLHHVTEEVDGGKIVLQKQLKVPSNYSYNEESLKVDVQNLEKRCLVEFISLCSNGQFNLLDGGYNSSGVNIDKGNEFVEVIKSLSEKNEKHIGGFCSLIPYGDEYLGMATDGVGTKLELANKYNKLDTIGIDLVAMSVNDLIARGVKPKWFLDYLAVNKLDIEKNIEIIKGIQKGCEICGCELVGGETAEMGDVYKVNGFDLAGFAVGTVNKNNILPKKIQEGDIILGIESNGLHSNGYSLVRKILRYSDYDIDELLKPTRIYNEVLDIIEECGDNVVGVAHITGGGLYENINRILNKNLKCEINRSSWEIQPVFKWIQEESGISNEELMRTYNCGIGMVIIIKKDYKFLYKNLIEIGKIISN